MKSKKISFIFGVLGKFLALELYISRLLQEVNQAAYRIAEMGELIIVVDGRIWQQAGNLNSLARLPQVKIVWAEETSMPAVLFNQGALAAKYPSIAFSFIGTNFSQWIDSIEQLSNQIPADNVSCLACGALVISDLPINTFSSWLGYKENGWKSVEAGWLEMADYLAFSCSLIDKKKFLTWRGFNCSPILQRGFWWHFCLMVARQEKIFQLPIQFPAAAYNLYKLPLKNDLCISGDMIARRVVSYKENSAEMETSPALNDVLEFLPAVVPHTFRRLVSYFPQLKDIPVEDQTRPLRVTVLGGSYEVAHNQLCFFNYFRRLEKTGFLSWRVIMDESATFGDMLNADLVIFSRVKSLNGVRLAEFCKTQKISALYMLDDNWFHVARDWPNYDGLFSPGMPLYENFLNCARQIPYVLTYNRIIAEDMVKFFPNVRVLPTNIDINGFPIISRPPKRRMRVGFMGSKRFENSWISALEDVVKKRQDFDIFVMGNDPSNLSGLRAYTNVEVRPYVFDYQQYSITMCEAAIDILLAPLGASRTEASKCPNKYLEITACGSVGIYSKVEPYISAIEDGKNGLLVDNNKFSWSNALNRLLDDQQLADSIYMNARRDVKKNYATENVLPQFCDFLAEVSRVYS